MQRSNYVDVCFLLGLDDIADGIAEGGRQAAQDAVVFRLRRGAQPIDKDEPVYLATSRLTILGEHESWSMHPFCRMSILNAAIRKFSGVAPDEEIPLSHVIRPARFSGSQIDDRDVDYRPDTIIVQGLDGAGAVFRRQPDSAR